MRPDQRCAGTAETCCWLRNRSTKPVAGPPVRARRSAILELVRVPRPTTEETAENPGWRTDSVSPWQQSGERDGERNPRGETRLPRLFRNDGSAFPRPSATCCAGAEYGASPTENQKRGRSYRGSR